MTNTTNGRTRRPLVTGAALLALALGTAGSAFAQAGTQSNLATVTLNAAKAPTISIAASAATLTLAAGITDNSAANQFPALSVTTNWTLGSGASLTLVGYFSNAAQALANGTNFIPTANVQGKLSTSATWNTFNGAAVGGVGTAGASLALWSQALTAATLTGTRTDGIDLRLNLVGFPNTIAGTYTGVLNLRAVVQ
jgi:hypothetical protein